MPTFRDSNNDFLMNAGLDAGQLESICEKLDAVFVIKMHINSPPSDFEKEIASSSRIIILRSRIDVYPLMAFADLLVTDYSSVMFEFILTRKPVVLFAFDAKSYTTTCRDFYIPFDEIAIGTRADTSGRNVWRDPDFARRSGPDKITTRM